jgi:hypothetical protein
MRDADKARRERAPTHAYAHGANAAQNWHVLLCVFGLQHARDDVPLAASAEGGHECDQLIVLLRRPLPTVAQQWAINGPHCIDGAAAVTAAVAVAVAVAVAIAIAVVIIRHPAVVRMLMWRRFRVCGVFYSPQVLLLGTDAFPKECK